MDTNQANPPDEPPRSTSGVPSVSTEPLHAQTVSVPPGGNVLPEAKGKNTISDTAVAKVAAIAARKVQGVSSLGNGGGRALGALRDAVGANEFTQGINVEVGETQVAVDINLVAEYGHPLTQVADQVRAAVYRGVRELVGLEVIEVNVEISDVHVPGLNDPKSTDRQRPAVRN